MGRICNSKISTNKGAIFGVLGLILLMGSLNLFGQDRTKKNITTADYVKWGRLTSHMLSEKGSWVCYTMQYDDLPDTVFVAGTANKSKFTLANANEGRFIGELLFVCRDSSRTLNLVDLAGGNVIKIPKVSSYEVSSGNRYLITSEQQDGKNCLRIRDLKGKMLEQVEEIVEFKMNNARDAMVCVTDSVGFKSVILVKLGKAIVVSSVAKQAQGIFSNLTWSDSNQAFAFVADYQGEHFKQGIFHYSLQSNKLNELDPNKNDSFPERFRKNARLSGITISPDDKRVIFGMREADLPGAGNDTLQIWHGNDPLEYSWKKHAGLLEVKFRLVVWWPQSGRTLDLADGDRSNAIVNASRDFALRYDYSSGGIQYQMERNVDLFVQDFESGKQELLVKNQSIGGLNMSPKGTYLAYFRNNEWWVYDFRKKVKFKLPEPGGSSWGSIAYAKENNAYGIAAWDAEEKYLLVNDRYDIWRVDLGGQVMARRLTRGSENKIKFRAVFNAKRNYFLTTADIGHEVARGQDILLSMANAANETGFSILKPGGEVIQIAYGPAYYSNLSKAEKANKFLFQSRNQDRPPSLIYVDLASKEKNVLFQSNAHHFNYHWGKQEIVSYKNAKNNELTGILYYPANYDPSRKYPMLVFVYEAENYRRHYYTNPSRYNMTGFNVSSLTAKGYFVLIPDIVYEIGNPGVSATDCVLAATNKVLSTGMVDRQRIALMGQSFGGYETNFILTQTNLFRAAISGVSIFDISRMYLSISESMLMPEIWRFESQQWRMGKSLYEDKEAYARNSPSTYVEKITTPMLIWAGEVDRQINPDQSIALYLALRRLEKKCVMLVYPKESHSIMLKKNQIDLYNRINDWLEYYLKDSRPAEWISEGTNR